ncbi:MAG: cytochrome b [Gammaproteobacteria bacterium]|nr:cytochrome b [Gammaproteobacteria bacterium]
MELNNNLRHYGLISILLHWGMAVVIIGLYFLGLYMVDLTYYDELYQIAPDIHRSLGLIMLGFLLFRWYWRLRSVRPAISGKFWEKSAAVWAHRMFYILILVALISGYLISTADGQPVSIFGWIDIPATFYGYENQEDIAGDVHEILTHLLMLLVAIHTSAALKHHFIERDSTLLSMLGRVAKK